MAAAGGGGCIRAVRGKLKLGAVCGGRGTWTWDSGGGRGGLGERERRWRGLGVEDAYGRCEGREVRCCTWGEGDTDIGRQWHTWRRPGERERRERGPGGSWRCLGEQERRK